MKLKLAEVLKPQGIKGEIKFRLLARSKDEVLGKQLFLAGESVTIQSIRESSGFLYIKFNEFNTVQEVEIFRGKFLEATREELAESLEEGEYFIADLVNKPVFFENGDSLGILTDVNNYGATTDVITVKLSSGKEVLLANVEGVIIDVTKDKVVFCKSKFDEVSV